MALEGRAPMSTWKVHHLGVAVRDLQEGINTYRELFGYTIRSGPFHDPVQRVYVCFLGLDTPGEPLLELVSPEGQASPLSRVLTRDNTAYHIGYEVESVDNALAELRGKGCVVVAGPVPATAFNGRRIAWLYTPTRQLVEVVEQ